MPRITRRTALVLLATPLAAPAIVRAQAARTLRFGSVHPIDHPQLEGGRRVAAVLAERTQGRLRLELFPSAQLGSGQDMVQQVSDGTLDFAVDGAALLARWDRRLSILEAPYLIRDWDHFQKAAADDWTKGVFNELREKRGIRVITPPWYFGTRQTSTRDKPINVVADFRGLKLRVPEVPLYMDFVRALGGSPTPMAFAEVYLGLQTGTVDGQENPLPTISAQKFYEVQKFINLTSHIVLGLFPMVSEKTFTSLSESDRAAVLAAWAEGATVNDTMTMRQEAELLTFFQSRGLTIARPELAPFRAAMLPVYRRYAEAWGQGTFERLSAIR